MKQATEPMGFVAERDCERLTGVVKIQPRTLHLYVVPHPHQNLCKCGQPMFRVVGFHDPEEQRKYKADAAEAGRSLNINLRACLSMGRLVE